MNKLFSPAIFIMNRLGFTQKIILLGGIYFIALSIAVYSRYFIESKEINKAQYELNGLTLIKPILRAIQTTQKHRGLSLNILGDVKGLSDQLSEEAVIMKKTFETLEVNLSPIATLNEPLSEIFSDYQQLQSSGMDLSKEENFLIHTRIVSNLQKLIILIADEHGLTLDTKFFSNYLVNATIKDLPRAVEYLGQLRAYGTEVFADHTITEKQKIRLYTRLNSLKTALNYFSDNMEKIDFLNENQELQLVTKNVELSSEKIIQLIHTDILTEQFSTEPKMFFNIATEKIDSAYTLIFQTLMPPLEKLFITRIQKANNDLMISIGVTFLLTVIALYLFFGLYYATITNIQLLARSARQYTLGDMQQRVHLETKDEIKQIGESFNEMADVCTRLLAKHLEGEERLQAILNTALDAIIQIDHEGHITGWCKQSEAMFGWSNQEAIGKKIHTLIIPPRYHDAHLKGMQNFMATGEGKIFNTRVEIEALNKHGNEFPIEIAIAPLKTRHGTEFSAFIRNLSQRKITENLLCKLSLAVEQSPTSIFITDKKANIEFVNQALLNISGYEMSELIGQNPRMFGAQKTEKSVYEDMWKHLSNGKLWHGELVNRRKNGEEYIESTLTSPVRQKNGEITHFLAIKEDITEKKRADIELGIAAIAFESQDGILVTDADNKIIRVNKAFTKITGYSSEEVIGKKPDILKSDKQDRSFYTAMWDSIIQTGSWKGEIWNRNKQGRVYPEWLTITARKDKNNNITHYVAIFTDFTEFKAAEAKIEHLAYYDPLTLLPNRRKLRSCLEIHRTNQREHGFKQVCLKNSTLPGQTTLLNASSWSFQTASKRPLGTQLGYVSTGKQKTCNPDARFGSI